MWKVVILVLIGPQGVPSTRIALVKTVEKWRCINENKTRVCFDVFLARDAQPLIFSSANLHSSVLLFPPLPVSSEEIFQ